MLYITNSQKFKSVVSFICFFDGSERRNMIDSKKIWREEYNLELSQNQTIFMAHCVQPIMMKTILMIVRLLFRPIIGPHAKPIICFAK